MTKNIDAFTACEIAANLVKVAGFELHYISMKSEARYYRFPGYDGLLRIAAHKGGKKRDGVAGDTWAKITFHFEHGAKSRPNIENHTATAIGFYFMRGAQRRNSPSPRSQQG